MSKKSGNVLILYNSIPYFLNFINRPGVEGSLVLRELSFPFKVIRRITRWLKLSQVHWFGAWKNDIQSIDTVIIFAPLDESEVLTFIKEKNKSIRIIYWYWNPVFRIRKIDEKHLKDVELWSFDPDDCKRFGMKFNTTFYFKDITIANNNIEYDTVFVGNDKGRGTYLRELEGMLNTKSLSHYFHIIPDTKGTDKRKVNRIPYQEYLELVSKTKAIIDIIPDGQSGLTIRPMESIFLKKKLITSNLKIVNQDFYNKQNIFIIGKDDESHLKEFINTPYSPLADSILYQYDLDGWLQRFKI